MMDMDGQEPLEYEHAMHGASRSGSCDGVVRSFGIDYTCLLEL